LTDITSLIERLVAAGADPIVAACVVAEAVVAGKNAAPYRDDLPDTRTKAAIRQKRYRDRNASVTKRNENVTTVTRNENVTKRNETITERNENVTPLRSAHSDISYLPTSSNNLSEKKESKKERVPRKRNAPLPSDWTPSLRALQVAEENGVSAQIVEQIFRDYLKSSGKLYADYDAAFCNFLRNQRRFNGSGNAKTDSPKGGSLINAIDRKLAALEAEASADFALSESPLLRISG
jgi:hypothetical protein